MSHEHSSQPSAPGPGDEPPPPYEAAISGDSYYKKEETAPLTGGYGQAPNSSPYPMPHMSNSYQTPHMPSTGQSVGFEGYPPGAPQYTQAPGYPPSGPGSGGPMGYDPYPPTSSSHSGGQQTVIIHQPASSSGHRFHDAPAPVTCPSCHAQVVTGVIYQSGTLTWIACAVLCLVGCDAGCCLIPFCMDSCKDAVHICPNCNQTIGLYNRL